VCPATNVGSDSSFRPISRYSHLPEDEIRGSEVIEMRGLLLLNHLLENADIIGLGNLDSEELC